MQRNSAQSAPYREYDVLDTEGRRVETWHMPKDQHIVAMGGDGLFVARTDEDGQLFLRRYQLPARNAATKRAR